MHMRSQIRMPRFRCTSLTSRTPVRFTPNARVRIWHEGSSSDPQRFYRSKYKLEKLTEQTGIHSVSCVTGRKDGLGLAQIILERIQMDCALVRSVRTKRCALRLCGMGVDHAKFERTISTKLKASAASDIQPRLRALLKCQIFGY
jgi:hypothetical protein